MNPEQESEQTRLAFREFALACRVERDRLARANLEDQDRRFESAQADREAADREAALLIALASR